MACDLLGDRLDHLVNTIVPGRHQPRAYRELVNWIERPGGTWACEVAGLRLRAGVSVPGWTTADLRGRLLAVKGIGPKQRERLLRVVAERASGWVSWTGMRPEALSSIGLSAFDRDRSDRPPFEMVNKNGSSKTVGSFDEYWRTRWSDLDVCWGLRKAWWFALAKATTLYYARHVTCPLTTGGGAVCSAVRAESEVVMLVCLPPDSTSEDWREETMSAVAAFRNRGAHRFADHVPGRRNGSPTTLRIEQARFEIVG